MGKLVGWIVGIVIVVLVVWFALSFFNVEQTQEGALPEVSVEGGQLPEVDVDAGSVDVGSEQRTVTVPTVEVNPPEEEADTETETPAAPANQ